MALPATIGLVGLVSFERLLPAPAVVAWVIALGVGAGLAWLRERRLRVTDAYLNALAEGGTPAPLPQFGPLGGNELATALHRLERAWSEERARRAETDRLLVTLLDALPDPLLVVTVGREVLSTNRAADQLFGQRARRQPLEASIRDPGVLAAVDEALQGRGGADATLQLPGPPRRAFGVGIVPVTLLGRPAALIGLRDLTEQLAIERVRSDFVANASHELRTPLAALSGFIETLAGPAKDDAPARQRFLATMAAEANRMTRLVNDLLSLSRIETEEHLLPTDLVDVIACLGTVVCTLQPYADHYQVRLDLGRVSAIPPVQGDRDQLQQLFTNLIDNAIKYGGDRNRVAIRCDYLETAPPGAGPLTGRATVRIAIQDHGPGIAREHLPRLTERFFRIDPARSRQLGGTGLGLAICKHIARRHRGHLKIDSEVGHGTTISVHLPVAERA